MRVLIVKMSSMGDIIHTLPAITDAQHFVHDIKFTWVVEPGFAEIPRWHPAVEKVILLPLRKWKGNLTMHKFSELRAQNYDVIIDPQGLFKSAIVARFAKSKIYAGYAFRSARESIASLFYNNKIKVSKELHAITRIRQLFAKVFQYKFEDIVNYGIDWNNFPKYSADKPYLFFLHGTTWESKQWPEIYWQQLAEIAGANGYEVYMTFATADQKAMVDRLASKVSAIKVLPHLTITQAMVYLKSARGVVAVDTGFAHLTAALKIPIVALYGSTDPKKVGVKGERQVNLQAKRSCVPCYNRKCPYSINGEIHSKCFESLDVNIVWDVLSKIIT